MCHGPFTSVLFIFPPIWEMMLSNYQIRCGKLTSICSRLTNMHIELCFCHIKRFPFDWRNPFGYLVTIIISYTFYWYELMIGACTISLAFGIYFYLLAMSKTIKDNLFFINNQSIDAKINKQLMLNQIVEFIDLHTFATQLSSIWWFEINLKTFTNLQFQFWSSSL